MKTDIDVSIALATKDDIPSILAISNRSAQESPANFATEPETLSSWMTAWEDTRKAYPWLVARQNGAVGEEILGFAKASPYRVRGAYAWTAEVSLYLRPDAQRRGIGTALYRRLFQLLAAQGYVSLIAGITLPNPASERIHESFGFVRCATLHRAGWKFDRWHDVGFWELHLEQERVAPRPIRDVREVWV